MSGRRALVAGATGLVGSALVGLLMDAPEYASVTALIRRAPRAGPPKLLEIRTDFERVEEACADLEADDAFCCLGTTRAQAGSAEAFRKVDEGYVLAFARAAFEAGAKRFLLVSSAGADARSPFLYPRVKGEVEKALLGMGFLATVILRPSLLLGERAKPRPGEALAAPVMKALAPLLVGRLRRYRAIEARTVARAMVRLALKGEVGPRILESDQIQEAGIR